MENSFRKYVKIERIEDATKLFMTGKICLDDIRKNMIEEGTDGKKYLHFIITTNKEMKSVMNNEYTHLIRYSKVKRGRNWRLSILGYLIEYTLSDEERKRREYKAKKRKYKGPEHFDRDDDDENDDEFMDEIDRLPF